MDRLRVGSLIALVGALAVAAGTDASAARGQDPQLGEMEEIFFLSGLEAQLDSFGATMDQSLAAQAGAMPAPQLSVLRSAVRQAFAGEALRESVRKGLLARYDVRGAAGTLAWLRSPLGRRITQLEEDGGSPEAQAQLGAYAQGLTAAAPPPERVALIDELQVASGVADVSIDLALTAALGIALGANAAQPATQRAADAEIVAAIEAQRGPMASQIEAVMQINSLYTYRLLTDEELVSYVEFAKSDAGRWYHAAVVQELAETLRQAASGIGAAVAQVMSARSSGAASVAP